MLQRASGSKLGGSRAGLRHAAGAAIVAVALTISTLAGGTAIAAEESAGVIVSKKWVIDGLAFDDGQQPPELQAALTLGGTAQDWGDERTGLTSGAVLAINETTSIAPGSLCMIVSSRLTNQNGAPVNLALPYDATLGSGTNSYEITNTATCPARLTLSKDVVNGPALPSAWTLGASAPSGALAFASGTSGVTHPVTPLVTYPLFETGGDPRYQQLVGNGAVAIPGSSGSWDCSQVDPTTGARIPGFADGLNGGVTIPRGYAVNCVARNQTAELTLVKHVVNDDGGTMTASAWTLTATPTAPAVPGLAPQTVEGSETGNSIWVRPGQSYVLSESPVAGYTNASLLCTTTTDPVPRELTQIALAAGDAGVCTFTNTQVPSHFTLTKSSDPVSGSTVLPGDTITYTLTAHNDSQGVVSGRFVTDDLSGVLDHAMLGTVGAGGSVTGTTLTWAVPTLQFGDSATLSYTVTVDADAYKQTLTNVATPGAGGDCSDAAACTITHPTPHFALSKDSQPARGSFVLPGQTVTYTLTATNDSDGVLAGALVNDDLSGVLDNATLGTVGSGASVTGTTLTWSVPTIEPGDSATLSYTVTVNEDAFGVVLTNVATPGSGGDCATPADCTTTDYTPRWFLAKSSDPADGATVDAGATITYTLTATNASSVTVAAATAVDSLPTDVTVGSPLPAGLTANPDGTLAWAIPDIPAGGSVSVSYTITVDDSAQGKTLVNVVVPGTPEGICLTAARCTSSHDVAQLIVTATTACTRDAAYLHYSIAATNVPDAADLPVTATWRTQEGTVVRVDTIPAGQLTGDLLWPGMVLDDDGVATGWPGWRALTASDFPLAADAEIYGTQIQDSSLPSAAYRLPMTVTFEMNPQATVVATYPEQTPEGCAVARDPDLHIVKTASQSAITPGQPFTYAITVRNASTLGVAYPVTVFDPIPAQLKVTSITTASTGFPHWQDCAITGADAAGYGGIVTCDLSASLGVTSAAPVITLTAVAASGASGVVTNTATTCWMNPSDAAAPRQCTDATATVAKSLPATGGGWSMPLVWTAVLLIVFGSGALLTAWAIRRRRHPTS